MSDCCNFNNLTKTHYSTLNDELIINKKTICNFVEKFDSSKWKKSGSIHFNNIKTEMCLTNISNSAKSSNACTTIPDDGFLCFSFKSSTIKTCGRNKRDPQILFYSSVNNNKQYHYDENVLIKINVKKNDVFCFGLTNKKMKITYDYTIETFSFTYNANDNPYKISLRDLYNSCDKKFSGSSCNTQYIQGPQGSQGPQGPQGPQGGFTGYVSQSIVPSSNGINLGSSDKYFDTIYVDHIETSDGTITINNKTTGGYMTLTKQRDEYVDNQGSLYIESYDSNSVRQNTSLMLSAINEGTLVNIQNNTGVIDIETYGNDNGTVMSVNNGNTALKTIVNGISNTIDIKHNDNSIISIDSNSNVSLPQNTFIGTSAVPLKSVNFAGFNGSYDLTVSTMETIVAITTDPNVIKPGDMVLLTISGNMYNNNIYLEVTVPAQSGPQTVFGLLPFTSTYIASDTMYSDSDIIIKIHYPNPASSQSFKLQWFGNVVRLSS